MKTSIKITAILIIALFAINPSIISQESTIDSQEYSRLDREKDLYFDNESETAEVKINVTDEYNFLMISVECFLTSGEMLLELLDPRGNKKSNFTIKTDYNVKSGKNTTVDESVRGNMEKAFRNPIKGDWIVRVKPQKAKGHLKIHSSQIYNPRADMLEVDQIKEDAKPDKE